MFELGECSQNFSVFTSAVECSVELFNIVYECATGVTFELMRTNKAILFMELRKLFNELIWRSEDEVSLFSFSLSADFLTFGITLGRETSRVNKPKSYRNPATSHIIARVPSLRLLSSHINMKHEVGAPR